MFCLWLHNRIVNNGAVNTFYLKIATDAMEVQRAGGLHVITASLNIILSTTGLFLLCRYDK